MTRKNFYTYKFIFLKKIKLILKKCAISTSLASKVKFGSCKQSDSILVRSRSYETMCFDMKLILTVKLFDEQLY